MPKSSAGISVNPGLVARPPRPFVAGGDLIGTPTIQTVTGIQQVPVSAALPLLNQILKFSGGLWTPQDESGGGGGPGIDIGAIHPASLKRMAGGLVLPNLPGYSANLAGSVLTATGRASVHGSVVDSIGMDDTGMWVLSDGVVYQVGHPYDNDVGAIPLYDNDSFSTGPTGPESLAVGGGYTWALTLSGSYGEGELTKIDPNVGATGYSGYQSGQAVITGRVTGDNFPGLDSQSQIFWSDQLGSLIVYCPNGFLDKPGGVFYRVDPTNLTVIAFTLDNTDILYPDGGFRFVAFKYVPDDGMTYALATFDGLGDSMTGTRLLKINLSTPTILDEVAYPGEYASPKLEYSNLLTGVFYWVRDTGTFHKTLRSPFQDSGQLVNVTATFAGYGGYWTSLWGAQTGGYYDQTIGIAVGVDGSYQPLIVDINLFDMTIAGSNILIPTEVSGIQPAISRVQYFPYPESGWWLFDDANAKAYRYFGFGSPSPYPRYQFGGEAEWQSPALVFDALQDRKNIRATWDGFSPVYPAKFGSINISFAGGEDVGAAADYSMILGGHDHGIYPTAVGAAIVGGSGNVINSGTNSIILGGTSNSGSMGANAAVVGGSLSSAAGDNSLASGRQVNANGYAAQAFGGNDYSGTSAQGDNSLAHGAGGYAQYQAEYVHGACDQNLGLTWQFGRYMFRGHSVNGSTATLYSALPGSTEEYAATGNKRSEYIFKIHIMATRIFGDAAFGSAAFVYTVTAHVNEAANALVIDSLASNVSQLNSVSWFVYITVSGLILRMQLQGSAGHTIRVTGWMEYGYCLAFPNS
jgi:hypothetical protein